MTTIGSILLGLGAFNTLLNVYLSFIRYPIHRARGGTQETYRYVSGLPVTGSLLLWISIPLLPSPELMWFAGILSIFDTGGIHWCIGTIVWHEHLRKHFGSPTDEN